MLWLFWVLYFIVWYGICIVLCGVVTYGTALYYIVLYGMVLYFMIRLMENISGRLSGAAAAPQDPIPAKIEEELLAQVHNWELEDEQVHYRTYVFCSFAI